MRRRRAGRGRAGAARTGAALALAALALAVGRPAGAGTLDPVCQVVAQPDAPVVIDGYTCQYHASGAREGGIRHVVRYKNSAARRTVAVQVGIVSFDAFDELIAASRGVSLEATRVNDHEEVSFLQSHPAAFSFHTGVAYVARVRFDDGTVWRADLPRVVESLRRVQHDFDPKDLQPAPAPVVEPAERE